MGIPKSGGLRGDHEIGGKRDFKRTCVTMPMNRSDHWLWQLLRQAQRLRMPPTRGNIFTLGDVAEIVPSRKALASAPQNNAADAGIAAQVRDVLAQLPKHANRQRIQLVRSVQCQNRQSVPVFAKDKRLAHVPRSTISDEIAWTKLFGANVLSPVHSMSGKRRSICL